jgi:hypothetical protein
MPDIVQESVDDDMFEPIDPITPDVYALWEPIAPPEGDDEGFEPIESSDSQFAQEFEPIPEVTRQPSHMGSGLIDLLMNPSPPSPPLQPERGSGDDSDDLIKF